MKYYLLVTTRQWQALQQPLDDNAFFPRSPFMPQSVVDYAKLQPVRYHYSHQMDEIIQHCVKYQDTCKNLYSTLEQLGLYYGNNTYHKDDIKFSAALKEALTSQRAILIEMPVEPCSGMLPPQSDFLTLPNNKIARRLTPDEVTACELARYGNEKNWIEITVNDLPNQPFTLFNHGSQKIVKQGHLDNNGYAYVDLPVNAQYVDIVFDNQQAYRPWYYDMPLQMLAGMRDAGQSVLDLVWDATPIKQTIRRDFDIEVANPVQLAKVAAADTIPGALTHGISQFLVGFIPAAKALKFIKPIKKMGRLAQNMIAGGVADFAVFAPHEERLSNLVQSFDELQNPVTAYLQASPDDSAAEGRLKNALEGLLLGALVEPFAHSLRALKYAKIKWMVPEVKTKVHYQLKAAYYENHNAANYDKLLKQLENQNVSNMSWNEPILAKVVKGDNGKINYGVGTATSEEANRLGKIWVGDGYLVDSHGGLISADRTRGYRFPSDKDSLFAETGIQANFETYQFNELGKKFKIGNAHLNIKD